MTKVEYPFATEEQRELADLARTILEKELALQFQKSTAVWDWIASAVV